METLQNYGFDIVVVLALGICAVRISGGSEQLYRHLFGDPERAQAVERSGLDGGVGSILLVIIIWLLNRASDIL